MNKKKIKTVLYFGIGALALMEAGWRLAIFASSKIPYSYRTDSMLLDTLAAVGLRNYNP